jgi:hypothetical protein
LTQKLSWFYLFLALTIPAFGAEVKIGSALANPGDIVALPVTVDSGVKGFCSFDLSVNPAKLTALNAPPNPIQLGSLTASASFITHIDSGIAYASGANVTPFGGPGTIALFPFQIPGDAAAGTTYELKLTAGFADSQGTLIPGITVTNGLVTVIVDKTAPKTTLALAPPANASGWLNVDAKVTLTATDNANGAGVREVDYSIDNGAVVKTPGSVATFVLTAEGVHPIQYQAIDAAGNVEALNVPQFIKIDKTLPVVTASAAAGGKPYASGEWTNQRVTVTYACSDDGSGVSIVSSPFTVIEDGGNQSAQGTCIDKAGNIAVAIFDGINIDRVYPSTTANVAPHFPYDPNTWYNSDVTIDLVAFHPYGDPTLHYSVDGAEQPTVKASPAAATVKFAREGSHSLTYYAVGPIGLVEQSHSLTIRIDKTPPRVNTTATTNGGPYVSGAWANHSVTVTYSCTDDGSGVDLETFPLTASTEGANQSVSAPCLDRATNVIYGAFNGINIDLTPPWTLAKLTQAADGNSTITFQSFDSLSGVASTSYRIDDGAAATYAGSFKADAPGHHTIHFQSMDKAGNVETEQGLTYSLPALIAPVDDASLNANPPVLSWNAVPGAILYEVEWTQDSSFEFRPIRRTTLTETSFQLPNALEAGKWYWRVKADIPDGQALYASSSFEAMPMIVTEATEAILEDFEDITDWTGSTYAHLYLDPRIAHNGEKSMQITWANYEEIVSGAAFVDSPAGRLLPKNAEGANPIKGYLWTALFYVPQGRIQANYEATTPTGEKKRLSFPLYVGLHNDWTKNEFDLTQGGFNDTVNDLRFVSVSGSGLQPRTTIQIDDLGVEYEGYQTLVSDPGSGDLTGDGKVTIQDVTLGLRMILGLESCTDAQFRILDVNFDAHLTIGDATLMLKQAVGLN